MIEFAMGLSFMCGLFTGAMTTWAIYDWYSLRHLERAVVELEDKTKRER